jgi:hypothetical protein
MTLMLTQPQPSGGTPETPVSTSTKGGGPSAPKQILYFGCSYCQFNTMSLDIKSEDAYNFLFLKIILYKGKYKKIP